MKTYFLPTRFKKEMRKVWGIPIFGKKKEVSGRFEDFIKRNNFKKVITVGDYCSLLLPSDVKIFDGKVKRRKTKRFLPFSLRCSNPPGTLSFKCWNSVKKAIKERKNLFVDGEEDLLVIPCVLLAGIPSLVVYGFPGKGICVIKVSPGVKKIFKGLLKKFETN